MALNFPKTPSTNEEYVYQGTTWVWDGTKWTSKGQTSGLPIFPDENGNVVITGNLVVNNNIAGTNLDLSNNLNVAGDIDND